MSSTIEQLLQDARTSVLESVTSKSISQSLVLLDQAWLEWHEKREEILRKVFSCSQVLNLDTATIWSGRALWYGADDLCPLKQIAMDFTRPLSVRVQAAFLLSEFFSVEDGLSMVVEEAITEWCEDHLQRTIGELALTEPNAALQFLKWMELASSSELECEVEIPARRVVWTAPVLNSTGFGDEARGFLGVLRPGEIRIQSIGKVENKIIDSYFIDKDSSYRIGSALSNGLVNLSVLHANVTARADLVSRLGNFADYVVMRTMFETDGLPKGAAKSLNRFDEIWVPGEFNLRTFRGAGVSAPIYPIGGGINSENYRRTRPVFDGRVTRFLSVFDWQVRKGWRILVEAWARAFLPSDPVELYLKVSRYSSTFTDPARQLQTEVEEALDEYLGGIGYSRSDLAPIKVDAVLLTDQAYMDLFRSADVYVCPSYGEGWGRPYMQAMAAGLPTIATDWSGQTEFMNSTNSYLIGVDEIVQADGSEFDGLFAGQNWAKPSADHLVEILQRVVRDKEAARRVGLVAMKDMAQSWSWKKVAEGAELRLQNIERVLDSEAEARAEFIAKSKVRIKVNWKGGFFSGGSLAKINLALASEYLKAADAVGTFIQIEHVGRILSNPRRAFYAKEGLAKLTSGMESFDVEIRHQWPPDFSFAADRLVVNIFPWEFQEVPQMWVNRIRRFVDQVWTPSNWTKSVLVKSGVDPEIVKVVPNGIDPEVYRPDGPKRKLTTSKTFNFLFVGGMIFRKGFDLLLHTFCETFRAEDDVALVIKVGDLNGAYRFGSMVDELNAAMEIPGGPTIEIVTGDLSEYEMAELYRSCDAFVLPYRGEGFGMPILEAMACGLPVVVPSYGPAPEFTMADSRVDFLFRGNVRVVDEYLSADPEFYHLYDPDQLGFKEALKKCYADAPRLRENALRNSAAVREKYSWSKVFETVVSHLEALVEHPRDVQDDGKSAETAPSQVFSVETLRGWPLKIEEALLRDRGNGHPKKVVELADGGYVTQEAVQKVIRAVATKHHIGDADVSFDFRRMKDTRTSHRYS